MTEEPILRQRRVALTQADTGLLLRRMMQEIPGLKVVDAASVGWPADTEHPHLRYWDGEGDPPDIDVVLWVESEGWREAWHYREDWDQLRLAPPPNTACRMDVCRLDEEQVISVNNIVEYLNERGLSVDAADPKEAMEAGFIDRIVLSEGKFWAIQYEDDEDHKAFLDKIFAILEEECSDRLVWVSSDEAPEPKVLKRFIWAGPDAIAWALSMPNRYFGYALRPLAAYPGEALATVRESYGLHIVETQKFHDFIHLQVPASWPVFNQPSGNVLACDEDSDNGTLWVKAEVMHCGEDAVEKATELAVESICDLWSEDEKFRDIARVDLGQYKGAYALYENVHAGTPLRTFCWAVSIPVENHFIIVLIDLVLTHDNLTDPLCEGVIEAIQQAVADIRIDEEAFLERVAPVH